MTDIVFDQATAPVDIEQPVTEVRLSTPAFAFKGKFSDVPLAPGVDFQQLTAGDPNPLFVVRPLAVLGAVSDKGLKYDAELIREIYQQVIAKKPPARQGHVSEQASDYEFPNDVGLWVGAKMDGDTLLGKAYIYPGIPFHQMIVKRKAAGSTLSNSIWGKGHFEPQQDGTRRLRGLDLESIDFAPAERAALEALGGQFETTSEMSKEVSEMADDKEQGDDFGKRVKEMTPAMLHEMMTKEQRRHCAETHVREMEPSSVYEMLPQAHKAHCAECYAKEFAQKMPAAEMEQNTQQIAEMQKQLAETTAAMTRSVQHIAEMQKTIAEYKQKDFDSALDSAAAKPFSVWNVRSDDGKKAIVSAQDNFKMYIVAQMAAMDGGAKIENIAAAAEAAWPKYEPQAALLRTALSGGNVITGVQGSVSEQRQSSNYGWNAKTGRYDDEVARQARAAVMGG